MTSAGSVPQDASPRVKRGLIRREILPLLEQLDSRARASLLSLADERPRLPRTLERTLAELLASRDGSKAADLGRRPRRPRVRHAQARGAVEWGPWTIESDPRARDPRPPAGGSARRRKKVQDLLVDAKVPWAERDAWPLVVSGDEVVAVPAWRKRRAGKAVTWKR